jgi:hypothetical protein
VTQYTFGKLYHRRELDKNELIALISLRTLINVISLMILMTLRTLIILITLIASIFRVTEYTFGKLYNGIELDKNELAVEIFGENRV